MKAFRHLVSGHSACLHLRRLLLPCLALLPPVSTVAATDADREAVREQLSRDWYYTEVIIFQRPAVLDFASDEALSGVPDAGFPVTLRSLGALTGPGVGASGPLWNDDPGCLAFPGMSPRALAAAEAQARADEAAAAIPENGSGLAARAADGAPPETEGEPAPAADPQLASDPLLDYLNTVADFESTLEARSLSPLGPDRLMLGREAARIDGDRRFEVLWHSGWLQAIPAREAPVPLLIQAGHQWGELYQLEGSVDVTLGRYLHFHTRLFYHEPLLGEAPIEQPVPAADTAEQPLGEPADTDAEERSVAATLKSALAPEASRFMVLDQSRRMRSGELHHLDHPKLGVLVRIEPVELPESLIEAFLALEETPE